MVEAQESKESGQRELLTYSQILDHQGPLKPHDPKYHGSSCNVLVSWDDGTQTWEPLHLMANQDLVALAKYAQEHDILNMLGWKFLHSTARQQCFINVILHAVTRHAAKNQVHYVEI